MSDDRFQKLLDASIRLLNSRYRDGEVDAVAMSQFADVVQEVDPVNRLLEDHAGHRMTVQSENSEIFYPRRGCWDCNVWLEEVRLKNPQRTPT